MGPFDFARSIAFFARAVTGVAVFRARVAASRWLFVPAEAIVAFAGLRVLLSPSAGASASKSANTSSRGWPSMGRLSRNRFFIGTSHRKSFVQKTFRDRRKRLQLR